MTRILALIYKEFIAIWQDKKSRFILLFPPSIQLLVFAFAATLDVNNVSIGILNRDNGEQSIELIRRFRGSPTFTHIEHLGGVEQIAPFIDHQKGLFVLSIDENFSRLIEANKTASVQLILDGRKVNASQIAAGYAAEIIDKFSNAPKIEFIERNWFNPNLLYYWFTVPGLLAILTLVETLMMTGLSIARERELGTFDQLLVSPLNPSEILIGKTIPSILIGIGEGTVIVLASIFAFQIPFYGSFLLLYLGMFFFTLAITGIGLFISSLCATQQQALLGTFLFVTPAILLSGYATPIENMPLWLQNASYLNPTRYFLFISRGSFLKAVPMQEIFNHIWPLALMALCTLTAAVGIFRARFISAR